MEIGPIPEGEVGTSPVGFPGNRSQGDSFRVADETAVRGGRSSLGEREGDHRDYRRECRPDRLLLSMKLLAAGPVCRRGVFAWL